MKAGLDGRARVAIKDFRRSVHGMSVGGLVCWFVGRWIGLLVGRLADLSVGCSVGGLICWLVGWWIGLLVGWLVGQSAGLSFG